MVENLLLILRGVPVTLALLLASLVLAVVMAFAAGLGRISRSAVIRGIATVYIEFFRGTSLFVQLFWAFYVLPLFGLELGPMHAAILALGLNLGAYSAEVVRGCIQSIGREQYEACVALNLTRTQGLRHVIVPQALLPMLPPFGNNAIEMLKMTSIASLISLPDLTYQAQVVRSHTGQTLLPFATTLVLYFLISMVIKALMRRAERRLARGADRMA